MTSRSLAFAWDPANNPEQARMKRAAIIAGTVAAGGLGLALYGRRAGWFAHADMPASASPAHVGGAARAESAVGQAPRLPSSGAGVSAPPPLRQSAIGNQKLAIPPSPGANPAAKSKLDQVVRGLNKGQAPKPAVEDKGLVERIVKAEREMRGLPERVRRVISRLHEQARENPTKAGRAAAQSALDKVLDKHGLTKGHLLERADRGLREFLLARGDSTRKLLWPIRPRWWRDRIPAMPPRGSIGSGKLAADVRVAYRRRIRTAKPPEVYEGDAFGRQYAHWAQQGVLNGYPTTDPQSPGRIWLPADRSDFETRFGGLVPSSLRAQRLCVRPRPLATVNLVNRQPLNLFLADKLVQQAKKMLPMAVPAATEVLVPGGTAINAAGIAGVRTAVHLRRILRKRYGPGFRGLANAALNVQPVEAAGIAGEAAASGVRDSRAFLRRAARKLPRPVARALNKKLLAARIGEEFRAGAQGRRAIDQEFLLSASRFRNRKSAIGNRKFLLESLTGKLVSIYQPDKVSPLQLIGRRGDVVRAAARGSKLARAGYRVDQALGRLMTGKHYGVGIGGGRIAEVTKKHGMRIVPQGEFGRGERIRVESSFPVTEATAPAVEQRFREAGERMAKGHSYLNRNCEHYARYIAGQGWKSYGARRLKAGIGVGAALPVAAAGGLWAVRRRREEG